MSSSHPPPSSSSLDLDQVYRLIADRASGRATNDQVEQAVSQLLSQQQQQPKQPSQQQSQSPESSSTQAAITTQPEEEQAQTAPIRVQHDLENYDDDDDDDEEGPATNAQATTSSSTISKGPLPTQTSTPSKTNITTNSKRRKKSKTANPHDYSAVPLGPQGAQMMIAFGDGPFPHPDALQKVLQGTRALLLSRVVRDARHVRRQRQAQFETARKYHRQRRGLLRDEGWDNHVVFQAQSGKHFTLPPCGFDAGDLAQLFPEAMNAYTKWSQMYQEQQQQQQQPAATVKPDKAASPDDDDDEEEEPVDVTDTKNVSSTETTGGHLRERAQQLDWRTYRMIQNRYLEFCDVRRQGSFLPQKLSSQHQIEWEEAQHHNNATTGTKRGHGWATLSFSEVRFLHWMGVSPYATADDGSNNNNNNGDDSATTAKQKQQQLDAHHQSNLSPPDPSTTHALAFLAHDFFGRIVEKAIAVHKERQKQEGANNRDTAAAKKKTKDPSQEGSDDGIQELQEHEQLTEQDVKQALEHPELQPTSLFAHHGDQKNSNSQSASSLAQLYFGPGFEDRVEMEMEELLLQHTAEHERHDNNKAGNDEEQRRWRQKEDELFDQLVQKAPGTEQDLVQLEQQQQQQPSTTTRKENKSKSKRSSPGTTGKKSTNEPKKKRRVAFSPKTKESPQDTAVTKPARKPRTRSARTKK